MEALHWIRQVRTFTLTFGTDIQHVQRRRSLDFEIAI